MSNLSKALREDIFPCLFNFRNEIFQSSSEKERSGSFHSFTDYWSPLSPLLTLCPQKFSFQGYYRLIYLQLLSLLSDLGQLDDRGIISKSDNSLFSFLYVPLENNLSQPENILQNISVIYSLYILNLTQPSHYLRQEYYQSFPSEIFNYLECCQQPIISHSNWRQRYRNIKISHQSQTFLNLGVWNGSLLTTVPTELREIVVLIQKALLQSEEGNWTRKHHDVLELIASFFYIKNFIEKDLEVGKNPRELVSEKIYRLPFCVNKEYYQRLVITVTSLIEAISDNPEMMKEIKHRINKVLIKIENKTLNECPLTVILSILPSILDPIILFLFLAFDGQFFIEKDYLDEVKEGRKNSQSDNLNCSYLLEKINYQQKSYSNPLSLPQNNCITSNIISIINESKLKFLFAFPNIPFETTIEKFFINIQEEFIQNNSDTNTNYIMFDNLHRRKKLLKDEQDNVTNRLRLIRLLLKQAKLRRKLYKDSNYKDNLSRIINILRLSKNNKISIGFFNFLNDLDTKKNLIKKDNIDEEGLLTVNDLPQEEVFIKDTLPNLDMPITISSDSNASSILLEEDLNLLRMLEEETNNILNIIKVDDAIHSTHIKASVLKTNKSSKKKLDDTENSFDLETLDIFTQLESNTDELLLQLRGEDQIEKLKQKKKTIKKQTSLVDSVSDTICLDDLYILKKLEEDTDNLFNSFNSSIKTSSKRKIKITSPDNSLLDTESLRLLEQLESNTNLLLSNCSQEEKINSLVGKKSRKKTKLTSISDEEPVKKQRKPREKKSQSKEMINSNDIDLLEKLENKINKILK